MKTKIKPQPRIKIGDIVECLTTHHFNGGSVFQGMIGS